MMQNPQVMPFICTRCGHEFTETGGFSCPLRKTTLCFAHMRGSVKDKGPICDACLKGLTDGEGVVEFPEPPQPVSVGIPLSGWMVRYPYPFLAALAAVVLGLGALFWWLSS